MSLFDSGIRPALDEWLLDEAKKVRSYGDYWSASSAGYCMRRNIFERLKVPYVEKESDGRKQRLFTAGHLFHDWIQGVTKEAGLSIASEVELQDEELMIRGHFDDLILVDGVEKVSMTGHGDNMDVYEEERSTKHLILYDYKTQNSRAFTYQKGRPMSYYHQMQLGTYMYMLRKYGFSQIIDKTVVNMPREIDLTEARILKISKDDLRMDEDQLLWSEELDQAVVEYWTALNKHWQDKTIPPCTCAEREGGFLAKELYNPYFYKGEPCSIEYYQEWKEDHAKVQTPTS